MAASPRAWCGRGPILGWHVVVGGARSLCREGHGDAVHAVSQAGGRRAVIEHVTEVAAAPAAQNFGASHAQAGVRSFYDAVVQRFPETWPTGATVELGI